MGDGVQGGASEELLSHAGFLRELARGLVRDAGRAEDLVQETFVAALERPPGPGSLRAWLATALRNRASNARRAERRRGQREERVARAEAVPPADEALARLETAQRLAALVVELREPYRTTIYLRYHAGLAPRAIAARTGVPVKTVKTRLARALAELRRGLDARGDGRERWLAGLVGIAAPGGWPSAGTSLAGGLLMKKLAFASVLVVLGLTLAWQGARLGGFASGAADGVGRGEGVPHPLPVVVEGPAAPAPPARAPREALPPAVERPLSVGALTVRVRRARDGMPLAGICVDVLALDAPGPRLERLHALSDADGRAHFMDLPAGRVRVFLATGATGEGEVTAGGRTDLELLQRDTLELSGQVVDPTGRAVVGAEIWIHNLGSATASHLAARTGAEGRFTLGGVEDHLQLGARAAGFRASLLFECGELPLGPSGAREVLLELRPAGARLAGRVLDSTGAPLGGAWVLAGPLGGAIEDLADGRRAYAPDRVALTTDARGEFDHPGDLDPGPCELFVAAPGAPVWIGSIELRVGERNWVEVVLEDAVRVRGRVIDMAGRPVAGAEVLATRELGREDLREPFAAPRARSDGEGLFLLELVPPGALELRARVPGHDRLGRTRASIAGLPGAELEVELRLELGVSIAGRVVDSTGAPLVAWSVFGRSDWLVEDSAAGMLHSRGLQRVDRTDAQGAFLLANLEPHPVEVAVAAPGEWPHPPRARAVAVRPGTLDLVLVVADATATPARITGRLVGADGRVPRDVRLVLWDQPKSAGSFVAFDAEDGAFEHVVPLPGRYVLEVARAGRTLLAAGPFELVAGGVLDVGTLRIGTPGRIEVELVAGPDALAADLELMLSGPGGASEPLEGGDAILRSGPLAPGTWRLALDSKGWFAPDVELEVTAGETARVRLEPQPVLPVDLAFEPVDPAANWSRAWIEIRDPAGNLLRRGGPWSRDAAGERPVRFHRLGLPPGHYRAEAHTDAGHQGRGDFTLEPASSPRTPLRFPLR